MRAILHAHRQLLRHDAVRGVIDHALCSEVVVARPHRRAVADRMAELDEREAGARLGGAVHGWFSFRGRRLREAGRDG